MKYLIMADLEKYQEESLAPIPSQVEGQLCSRDAVFGEITEEGPNYRNVSILVVVLSSSFNEMTC